MVVHRKERSSLDWITGITRALDYIEENITESIDYEKVARCAYASSFHFQRVFSVICGFTLGDYIRWRKLSLAGKDLAMSEVKVIDIAMKYGYETPESFSRAFTKFHNVSPIQAKKGATIKSFSKLSVKLTISGGTKMDYRFEKQEAIQIVVKKQRFSKEQEVTTKEICAFWEECQADGAIERLIKYIHENNVFKDGIIGVGLEYVPEESDFPYGIGCHYNGVQLTEKDRKDFEVVTLPKAQYVVFPCKGKMPEAFQSVYKYVFEEFFPNSEYQPCGVEIEVYPSNNAESPDFYWELWLAVEKK